MNSEPHMARSSPASILKGPGFVQRMMITNEELQAEGEVQV